MHTGRLHTAKGHLVNQHLAGEELLAGGAGQPELCSAAFLRLIWKTGELSGTKK